MSSAKVQNSTLFSIILLMLALGLGLVLERKFQLLDVPAGFLRSAETQQHSAELSTDPGLSGFSPSSEIRVADPSSDDFPAWRLSTRKQILALGGSDVVPEGNHTASYRTLSETLLEDGTRRQFIAFESFDGSEIPAYLHLPAATQPLPAILVIPGHVGEGQSGIEQLANEDSSYQHAAALRLAEAGFVTLTPELRGFGYLGAPHNTEHRLVAYNAILNGTSYKWIALRDLGYAMALLRQSEFVDTSRIGVTGASLGGELAVNYAALDPAVAAVVFQSFSGGIGPKTARRGGRDDQPHYCHTLPLIDRFVAQEHWYWLLAPRPVLGIRGSENHPFDDNQRETYALGWNFAGAPAALELQIAKGGHEYFVAPAVDFFKRTLGAGTP